MSLTYFWSKFILRTGSQVKRGEKKIGEPFFVPQATAIFFVAPLHLGSLCTDHPSPFSDFYWGEGGSVHRLHLGACSQANRKGASFI